jgi:hypothetical protein
MLVSRAFLLRLITFHLYQVTCNSGKIAAVCFALIEKYPSRDRKMYTLCVTHGLFAARETCISDHIVFLLHPRWSAEGWCTCTSAACDRAWPRCSVLATGKPCEECTEPDRNFQHMQDLGGSWAKDLQKDKIDKDDEEKGDQKPRIQVYALRVPGPKPQAAQPVVEEKKEDSGSAAVPTLASASTGQDLTVAGTYFVSVLSASDIVEPTKVTVLVRTATSAQLARDRSSEIVWS